MALARLIVVIGTAWGWPGSDLEVYAAEPPPAGGDTLVRERLERGRKIYNFRCYYCHGYSGNARTLAKTFLDPPPRDFTQTPPEALSKERMVESVTRGRAGTAMAGFATVLSPTEVETVVDFVRDEFMIGKRENTRYHTPENGWFNHDRHAVAFPFATGEIPLDTPDESLTPDQRVGKTLFLNTCISCHDRAHVLDEGPIWEARPVSFPRGRYSPITPDAMSGATPYAIHDQPPKVGDLSPQERRGEALFQKNCAFCHGADGTGRNWIGRFLEPHPRDLTDTTFMSVMNKALLAERIAQGLPGTSMPSWKGVLQDDEIRDIVHYVARVFHPLDDHDNPRE